MKRALIISVLFTGSLFAAERPLVSGGTTNSAPKPAPQVAPQAGQGEQHQRPDPAQMVTQMMSQFDANKDGVLSQDELTQALGEMRKNHPQRPAQGGQQGGAPAGAQQPGQQAPAQGAQGEQRHEPPAADKVAAQMIEKFAADKKGLTAAELTKALEERHGQGGGGQHGERPARPEQK